MARRFRHSDNDRIDRPTEDQAPLTGYIQLKPGRNRQGNKTWRTPGPDSLDLGDSLTSSFEVDSSSSLIDPSNLRTTSAKRIHPRLTTFDLPTIKTSLVGQEVSKTPTSMDLPHENLTPLKSTDDEGISPTDTRFNDVMGKYKRVFGKLPDLIYLHEKLGGFDGEIAFIGHPNRDISAHQWSAAIFQWVAIGTWSQNRRKVEGSLAADRVPATHFQPHTIEWFKFAAEHREAMIKQFGRAEEETEKAAEDAEVKALQPMLSESPISTFTTLRTNAPLHRHASMPASVPSSSQTITRHHLEDPFVTPAKPHQPAMSTSLEFRSSSGTMDLSYQFPHTPKFNNASYGGQQAQTDPQQIYAQRNRLSFLHPETASPPPASEAPSYLGEVGFGEEAATSFSTPAARTNSTRLLSPTDSFVRKQIKNKLSELGSQLRRSTVPAERQVAIPDAPVQSPGIRALFPPGLTVANPHRGIVSTLNANAPPYNRLPTVVRSSNVTESELTSIVPPGPKLLFSDPDANLPGQIHEVANGLDNQVLTPQNFSGPFFADSTPTPHNFVTYLTMPLREEEKLASWFSDGQNPARQQGFAKSLVATARADNKARNLGAIGENSPKEQDGTQYENTHILARVYENLLHYAEEYHAGHTSSYFTRAWKPAPIYLRDLVPEGNYSFFNDTSGPSPQLLGSMLNSKPNANPWLKFGPVASSMRAIAGKW